MTQRIPVEPSPQSSWGRWKPIITSSIAATIATLLVAFLVLKWKGVPELIAQVQQLQTDVKTANDNIKRHEGIVEEQGRQLDRARENVQAANAQAAQVLNQVALYNSNPDKVKRILEAISDRPDAAALVDQLKTLDDAAARQLPDMQFVAELRKWIKIKGADPAICIVYGSDSQKFYLQFEPNGKMARYTGVFDKGKHSGDVMLQGGAP